MKQLAMLALVSLVATACSSQKEPAQTAVHGLETAVANARPEVERYAADRLAGMNDAVAGAKAKLDNGDFAGAMADAQAASNTVTAAAEAAASRKAGLSTEWAAFAAMPATIGQIKAKLQEVEAMRRLPRGMDRTRINGAKSSLESLETLWEEASDAHEDGGLVVAVSKARAAKPIADALMATFGLVSPAM